MLFLCQKNIDLYANNGVGSVLHFRHFENRHEKGPGTRLLHFVDKLSLNYDVPDNGASKL